MRPEPTKRPAWLNEFPYYKYWDLRLATTVSVEKFFSWFYRYKWDCELKISATFVGNPDALGRTPSLTYGPIQRVLVATEGRDIKTAEKKADGTWNIIDDVTLNNKPRTNGKIPNSWFPTQKRNPCLSSIRVRAFFNAQFTYTNAYLGYQDIQYFPNPPSDSQVFPDRPEIISKQVNRVTVGNTRHFYATYTSRFQMLRTMFINPNGGVINGSYISLQKNKIWPGIVFDGEYLVNDWAASYEEGFAPKDSDQPSYNIVNTTVKIDGVTIPAGTKMNPIATGSVLDGFSDSGTNTVNISLEWTRGGIRDP